MMVNGFSQDMQKINEKYSLQEFLSMSKINQQIITAENKVSMVKNKVVAAGVNNFNELKNYYVNKPWKQI